MWKQSIKKAFRGLVAAYWVAPLLLVFFLMPVLIRGMSTGTLTFVLGVVGVWGLASAITIICLLLVMFPILFTMMVFKIAHPVYVSVVVGCIFFCLAGLANQNQWMYSEGIWGVTVISMITGFLAAYKARSSSVKECSER